MLRIVASVLALLLLCVAAAPSWAQGTFDLKYESTKSGANVALLMARRYVIPLPEKPTELKGVPGGLTGKAAYLKTSFGDKDVFFIVDGAKLYADTNRDGDLSDEKPFEAASNKTTSFSGPGTRDFGTVTIAGPQKGSEVKVRVGAYGFGPLLISPAGFRTGKVKLAGRSYLVAIVDGNFDGFCNTVISLPFDVGGKMPFDFMAFDFNANGTFEYSSETMEVMPLTRIVCVNDAYYSIKVAADGSSIRMAKVQPEFGTLDLKTGDADLMLWSDCGFFKLTGADGKWRLPAGGYTTIVFSLSRTDKDGSKWALRSSGKTGKLQNFRIRPGKTLSPDVGGPLTAVTTATQVAQEVSISFSLEGRAGEQYAPGAQKDGKMVPAPTLKILDKGGKTLATGKFEYG